MTSLLSIAHICVGLSLGVVAAVFGKHVHPTGHCAPIIVLSGSGIPVLVAETKSVLSLVKIMIREITNKVIETIKRKMANPSI